MYVKVNAPYGLLLPKLWIENILGSINMYNPTCCHWVVLHKYVYTHTYIYTSYCYFFKKRHYYWTLCYTGNIVVWGWPAYTGAVYSPLSLEVSPLHLVSRERLTSGSAGALPLNKETLKPNVPKDGAICNNNNWKICMLPVIEPM